MIVKYSKKFPYAPFLNEDIGFETEVNATIFDGDEELILLALRKLKSIAEKFHKENNPGLYVEVNPDVKWDRHEEPYQSQSIPTMDYKERDRLEQLIEKADSVEVLAAYKEAASQHGAIKTYMDKLKKLTQ